LRARSDPVFIRGEIGLQMPTRIHQVEAGSFRHEYEPMEVRFSEKTPVEVRFFSNGHLRGHWVTFPPLLPYVPDEEVVSELQECPQCRGSIHVSEAGFTYCTKCMGLICANGQLEILRSMPEFVRCPECLGHLEEDDYDSWEVGVLCCHLCGNAMDWRHLDPDGVQILTPVEEVFWPLDTDQYDL